MWLIVAFLLSFVTTVVSYAGGPPISACTSMTPNHYPTIPQTTTSTFYLSVDKNNYSPGEQISVTLSSCDSSTFKGFMLQARRADHGTDTSTAIGTFSTPSGTKGLTCGADFAAVVHSSAQLKSSMTFTWTAPASSVGHIVFTATFVEQYDTIWVKVNSKPVRDNSVATAVTPGQLTYPSPSTCEEEAATITTVPPPDIRTTEMKEETTRVLGPGVPKDPDCGHTKGCIYDCYDRYCKVGLNWATLSTTKEVLFEMSLITLNTDNMWMAMGLSGDMMMGNDSVVECVMHAGSVRVYSSKNRQYIKHNERVENVEELRGIGGSLSDGIFKCSFALSLDKVDMPFYILEENHHILVATGRTLQESDEKQIHTETLVTSYPIDLMDTRRHEFGGWVDAASCRTYNVFVLILAAVVGMIFWRN